MGGMFRQMRLFGSWMRYELLTTFNRTGGGNVSYEHFLD